MASCHVLADETATGIEYPLVAIQANSRLSKAVAIQTEWQLRRRHASRVPRLPAGSGGRLGYRGGGGEAAGPSQNDQNELRSGERHMIPRPLAAERAAFLDTCLRSGNRSSSA